jgi:flagellar M-ring protein FliF
LLLAREGIPNGGSIGYEIFDNANSITSTQTQQNINKIRALEGELARTIRAIDGVRNARVHLVLPQRAPFEREPPKAKASVLLTLGTPGGLDLETVKAIAHLVATAVPALKVDDITVVDSRGNLLSNKSEQSDAGSEPYIQNLRSRLEARVSRSVEEMLERVLGAGNVRAEASLDLNYARVRETTENFDPNGQVVRSTQSNVTTSESTDPGQAGTSVQNNLPNADAAAGSARTREQKQEEITNYEITKSVRDVLREQALIQRLSLAVIVNGTYRKAPDGTSTWQPLGQQELERITALVKSAVGFDPKRGDQVVVDSLQFQPQEASVPDTSTNTLLHTVGTIDPYRVAQILLPSLAILLIVSMALRPAMKSILVGVPGRDPRQLPAGVRTNVSNDMVGTSLALQTTDASQGPAPVGALDSGGQLSNVEGVVRAATARKLAALVESHPEESLSILRSWLQQEGSP